MNRRDAIKRTALLIGGTLSASAVLGVLNGCKADPALSFKAAFFNPEEGKLLEALVERIIPQSDTPGAVEAGVPAFIDTMMAEFYSEKEKNQFRAGLNELDAKAISAYKNSFAILESAQQDELLAVYDSGAYQNEEPNFFRTIKELTILGYFNSEAGATMALYYDPVPENYQGCIDINLVGRAWAM